MTVIPPSVQPNTISEADLQAHQPMLSGKVVGWTVGCSSAVFMPFILFAAYFVLVGRERLEAGDRLVIEVLIISVPVTLGFLAARFARSIRKKMWRKREFSGRMIYAQEEAARVTAQVRAIQFEVEEIVKELPSLVGQAQNEIRSAQAEYDERAYSPFWDRIAKAAYYLASYSNRIERMAQRASDYSDLLAGRDHSFPATLSIHSVIARPDGLGEQLKKLARQGQRDFEFAMIWEHHKTRQILVDGFSTLASTLDSIDMSLQVSLSECGAKIVEAVSDSARELRESVHQDVIEIKKKLGGS